MQQKFGQSNLPYQSLSNSSISSYSNQNIKTMNDLTETFALLLGVVGQGKTTLFNKLVKQENSNQQKQHEKKNVNSLFFSLLKLIIHCFFFFFTCGLINIFNIKKQKAIPVEEPSQFNEASIGKQFYLVDCPSICLSDGIDERERCIKQFQRYFSECRQMNKQIICFFIVVKFERTELMRKKVQEVAKHFIKFRNMFQILITDFELSENKDKDKEDLQKDFCSCLSNQNLILNFIENSFQQEQLTRILSDSLQQQQLNQNFEVEPLDLNDTIFEPENVAETSKLLRELNERLQQRCKH